LTIPGENELKQRIQAIKASQFMLRLRDDPPPEPQTDDEAILAFVYGGHRWGSGIQADEAICLYTACEGCTNLLEVGQAHGISTRLLGMIAHCNYGTLISIDPCPAGHNEADFQALEISGNIETIRAAAPWMDLRRDWELDAVFIDGDHSYIAVLTDYHCFNYFLKKDGIVAFHDVNMREVNEAIYEIKKRDRIEELYHINRLKVFRKTTQPGETYFQRILR
jgi:predicted O-methyltransferase YrrM